MLLVDDLAAGGTKNLRHTPRGLVTLIKPYKGVRHPIKYDTINDVKLFPTVYHRIFLCYPMSRHVTKASALELSLIVCIISLFGPADEIIVMQIILKPLTSKRHLLTLFQTEQTKIRQPL